jgi:hypothetical protein
MRRGSLLIEFALMAGGLVAALAATANFSAAWRTKTVLMSAAREGARVASRLPDLPVNQAAVFQAVDEVVQGGGLDPAACVRTMAFASPLAAGDPVTVTVRRTVDTAPMGLIPGIGRFLPLSASSTMRYEARSPGAGP